MLNLETKLSCHGFLSRRSQKLLIGGQWLDAESGRKFTTRNPATDEILAEVAEGSKPDIDRAVACARKAFEQGSWPSISATERARLMFKLSDLIEKHTEELAQLETLDNGKPIQESRHVDLPKTIEIFRYYAGWATKLEGETVNVDPSAFTCTVREPVGVVGQIIPFNLPLMMAAFKLGPALACGNTVILKPAEQAPLTALRLGELICEAGFPDGVVNIVTGFGAGGAGQALAEHMDVDKIAFTGHERTGRQIVACSAGNLKRVSLELGGKAPNIVFADADLDKAVDGAIMGIFFNQGQVCCACSRLFLEKSIHDTFLSKLAERARNIRLGPGLDESTQMGPLVSREQQQRVLACVESALSEGADLVCGGSPPGGNLAKGYYVQPTILKGVHNAMKIAQEEVFGPVLAVIPFSTEEEVCTLANDVAYGLSAAVWTEDIKKAHRLAKRIKAGTIWINCTIAFDAAMPFGGYKMSGYGRELGRDSLALYSQVKSIWVNLSD